MTDETEKQENIVRFPGQRAEQVTPRDHTDDPLDSLLQEFEEISQELEDRSYEKESAPFSKIIPEEFLQHPKGVLPEEILANEFSRAMEFQTRINLLHEVNKRIKYYLDEIETFVPRLKNSDF
ncbi:MAG: hypothetical protein NXH75_12330 [Halobacteriovoraceae bacterium]|nr:hypothetical protein [Halobacteriovoraceae bacterium]